MATMTYSPADCEVHTAIQAITHQQPDIGLQNLRSSLLDANRSWTISLKVSKRHRKYHRYRLTRKRYSKRLRVLKQTCPSHPPNALIIKDPTIPALSLDSLICSIEPLYIPTITGTSSDLELIAQVFQSGDAEETSHFYDRDPHIVSWYYQCYGPVRENRPTRPSRPHKNSVAHWLKLVDQRPLIVMKNGPSNDDWQTNLSITLENVARSLWWYHKSGNNREQVFGERELTRFLRNL